MISRKNIYLLIGQKGSGKSLAGQIIQDNHGIKFVRVEDIARRIKKGRKVDDETYHSEVFAQIESHLREVLVKEPSIVFESTGLGASFDQMMYNLKRDFKVITIAVEADPDLCLRRIKSRDPSTHINVSDDDIEYINSLVRQRNLDCEIKISNNGSREEFTSALGNILSRN